MSFAMSAGSAPVPCGAATRAAPASSMARTDHGLRTTQRPQLAQSLWGEESSSQEMSRSTGSAVVIVAVLLAAMLLGDEIRARTRSAMISTSLSSSRSSAVKVYMANREGLGRQCARDVQRPGM